MENSSFEDASLNTEATVTCPHCGEHVVIAFDPGGGSNQQYIEDCQVCCRPWQVSVWYDETGEVSVQVDPTE